MDNQNISRIGIIKQYIQSRQNLPDDAKSEYINCLEGIETNKKIDAEKMIDLMDYLDNEFYLMEEEAMKNHDTDSINELTAIRNGRTEMEKNIFMLYDPEDPAFKESPEEKDKAVQEILQRISLMAKPISEKMMK